MTTAAPGWLVPVIAIFVQQTTASFLCRFIPIIAPAVAVEFGWGGSSIGYLTASNALGGLAILVAGTGLLKQIGGMRALQLFLLIGAVGMFFFLHPSLSVVLAACFVMGLSTGAANPAGSEVLQRFSPPGHRNLMFSIKQAGVPLGGVIAGLLIPALVVMTGWRIALFVSMVLVVLATLATWPASARCDEPRAAGPWRWSWPGRNALNTLREPLRSLRSNSGLLRISIVGSLFAVSQNCWFTFTVIYLIDELDFSLGMAGAVYAIMQTGGVIGRIMLGWLSDHLRSATIPLSLAAIVSALTTIMLGLSTSQWPAWSIVALALVAGGSAASWNGVQIAEVARRSPPHLISETASGASILVSLVNMLVPAAIAAFVAFSGRYDYAFFMSGVVTLSVLVCLPRKVHSLPASSR